MKFRPLISIIVPIYNVERYLEKCIESIIQQTYQNIEVILVNDGSTDGCLEVCKHYINKDSRIKLIDKANGGLSSARNAGLKLARGEYIAFVDSDDWIDNDMYEILIKFMIKNELDIGECGVRKIYSDKKVIEEKETSKEYIYTNVDALHYFLDGNKFFKPMVCNKLFHKSIFYNNKFKEGYIHEDGFFTYKAFYDANKIGFIDINKYNYLQQREGSIMTEVFSEKRMVILEAFLERTKFFEIKGQDDLKEKSFREYIETAMAFYCQAYNNLSFDKKIKENLKNIVLNNTKNVKIKKHGIKTKMKCILFCSNERFYANVVNYKNRRRKNEK